MNKSDLVTVLAERANITMKKAEEIVNGIFDSMTDTLINDGRIEIRGFGSFINKKYESYQGRNPKTKEAIVIPPKKLPFFKVGKELKQRVNQDSSEDNEQALGQNLF